MRERKLSELTTLGIGGPARVAEPTSERELLALLRQCAQSRDPVCILGGGSNVIARDTPCESLVVHLWRACAARSLRRDGDDMLATLGASVVWDEWVAEAATLGLAGHECLAGIPGLVGATPIQNVGAYGVEVASSIVHVRAYDRVLGAVVELSARDCEFGYRSSRFKQHPAQFVVLDVTFRLAQSADSVALRFGELCTHLGVAAGGRAPAAAVRQAVLALRKRKGMVLDSADTDTRSVGSFFTNPVVSQAHAAQLQAGRAAGDAMPAFPTQAAQVKLAAAWLIERAGFPKGTQRGGVGTSTKHALALVNRGGGTAAELLAYAQEIEDAVYTKFDVRLEREPVLF